VLGVAPGRLAGPWSSSSGPQDDGMKWTTARRLVKKDEPPDPSELLQDVPAAVLLQLVKRAMSE